MTGSIHRQQLQEHTEYDCIDITFPHWALVESRMGPLWHGTQASGADKTKHEGSDIIKVLHVRAYSTYSRAANNNYFHHHLIRWLFSGQIDYRVKIVKNFPRALNGLFKSLLLSNQQS